MKKTLLTLSVATMLGTLAQAQTINTFAGTGTAGNSGDGGPAIGAQLKYPTGVCADLSGNIYIADSISNVVRKVSSSGTITTFAGNGVAGFSGDGGQATAAELHNPCGVAADASGNIYIADYNNYRVREVSSGIISTFAGNGNTNYSGDGGPATAAEIAGPAGVCVDASNTVYIADEFNNVVRIVSGGVIGTYAGTGISGFTGDGGQATAAHLHQPVGVSIDNISGNLYIADYLNNRIRMVNTSGVISTIAGTGTSGYSGDGGPATAAEITHPYGVIVDKTQTIYIADFGNNVVRRVSKAGTMATVAGNGTGGFSGDGGPANAAEVNGPFGVGTDLPGNLYIGDAKNHRVRVVSKPNAINEVIADNYSLTLYPNPASQTVNLTFDNVSTSGKANIEVIDITGKQQMLTSTSLSNGKVISLNVSSFANGVYFVRVTTGSQAQVLKFVKE